MEKIIYVQLLSEGTIAYRPVSEIEVGKSVFEIIGFDTYNPKNEIWTFSPGTYLLVEERDLSRENVLVAIIAVDRIDFN